MVKSLMGLYLRAVTRLFDLPEFVICRLSSGGIIQYLRYSSDVDPKLFSVWTTNQDDALLFSDIDDIKKRFCCYNKRDYLVISYLDGWTDNTILQELKPWT
jgi:hypothetical protein